MRNAREQHGGGAAKQGADRQGIHGGSVGRPPVFAGLTLRKCGSHEGVWGSPVSGAVAKRESRVTECFIYGAGLGHLLHKLLYGHPRASLLLRNNTRMLASTLSRGRKLLLEAKKMKSGPGIEGDGSPAIGDGLST
ncbi:uncharacterized protein LOC142058404 [Phalacrocorax aristotelis]|uniref:uncharacterized protein LOC142058404 n=1 Tax=Phalacrocorax aristotelis TaxID=126867 RepID=UPI003F4C1FB1